MSGIKELRRLERWMTYVRAFGVVFGVTGVAIQPNYPNGLTERLAWGLVILLAVGASLIWGTFARLRSEDELRKLGAVAFTFDTVVICSLVWIYAYEVPYITWALLLLIPTEAALRYRLKGALAAAGGVAAFFVFQSLRVAHIHDAAFDLSTYVFVVGLSTLIAGVTGSMAENWYAQRSAFESQREKLAEMDLLKDRFLAITSHEIRGPLTAIIAGVDTVWKRGQRLTPEQRDRLLEIVHQQGHQLARLVDDLLVTTQIQAGRLTLRRDWAELESVVRQALEAAGRKRRGHQLELFVDPLKCEIDAARVSQVVRNLVENAFKYTPDRTRVAVEGKSVAGGIQLRIVDDGPGIPADKRDRLFEAFSRIEETAAGQEGVGLGLFVVSELVGAMEGTIDLASSSKGTVFTIQIPCEYMPARKPQLGLVESASDEAAR